MWPISVIDTPHNREGKWYGLEKKIIPSPVGPVKLPFSSGFAFRKETTISKPWRRETRGNAAAVGAADPQWRSGGAADARRRGGGHIEVDRSALCVRVIGH